MASGCGTWATARGLDNRASWAGPSTPRWGWPGLAGADFWRLPGTIGRQSESVDLGPCRRAGAEALAGCERVHVGGVEPG
jgi:hypothetical protein